MTDNLEAAKQMLGCLHHDYAVVFCAVMSAFEYNRLMVDFSVTAIAYRLTGLAES